MSKHQEVQQLTFVWSSLISFIIFSPWDCQPKKNEILAAFRAQILVVSTKLSRKKKCSWTFFSITRLNPTSRDFSSCCNCSMFNPWSSSPLICLFCMQFNVHVHIIAETEIHMEIVRRTLFDGFSLQPPCLTWSGCCSLPAVIQIVSLLSSKKKKKFKVE